MTETNIIARFAIVTIGLVGNFISFLIFSRKSFKNNSINVYSRALAISDSIIVGFEFSTDLAWVFYKYDLFSSSTLLCKVSSFVFVGFSPLSGWILVAFSIDKLVNVLYPNRFEIYIF